MTTWAQSPRVAVQNYDTAGDGFGSGHPVAGRPVMSLKKTPVHVRRSGRVDRVEEEFVAEEFESTLRRSVAKAADKLLDAEEPPMACGTLWHCSRIKRYDLLLKVPDSSDTSRSATTRSGSSKDS